MKNFLNKNFAFTLIELLVSVSIILMLLVAAMPNLNKVQSKNRLRSSGEIIQNCIAQAKSFALAPDTDVNNLIYYKAVLYSKNYIPPIPNQDDQPNRCLVYQYDDNNTKIMTKFKLSNNIRLSRFTVNSATLDTFTYYFTAENHGSATREANVNNEMSEFSVEDEKLDCQQLKFFYETGEILLEKFGTMNLSNQCVGP